MYDLQLLLIVKLPWRQVERKEYVVNTYELTSLADLEQFWWDMHEICVNTPLGGSSLLHGQEITIEVSNLLFDLETSV